MACIMAKSSMWISYCLFLGWTCKENSVSRRNEEYKGGIWLFSMSHCLGEPQRKMHSMLNNALFSSRRQPKYLPNRLQRPESRRILHCWHIILNRNSIPKWMACESIAAKWWADCAQFSCRFYTLRFDRSHPSDPIQKILSTTYLFRYFIECRN